MKMFTKIYTFNAPLALVMKALTDHDLIERWTGSVAFFDPTPGGKFSLWDDTINGKNIFIDEEQIVQDWKEETWEKYSQVTINLIAVDENVTDLELVHENIPDESSYSIREGWDQAFMMPLEELLDDLMDE